MAEQFDLVVIGGGPGGYSAVLYAASAGLKAALPRATITYTRGAEISGDSTAGFEAAVEAAKRADLVVMESASRAR